MPTASAFGKNIVVDNITVHYNTQSSGAYLEAFYFTQADGVGSGTNLKNPGALGSGTSGDESYDIIGGTPVEISSGQPLGFQVKQVGASAKTDTRFYSAVIKYHVKVHG